MQKEDIGHRLIKYRKEINLTQKQVAHAIGCPETTYRNMEYGKQGRELIIYIQKLAHLFGKSIEEIITGREEVIKNQDIKRSAKIIEQLAQKIIDKID